MDTVILKLTNGQAGNVDLLAEVPARLSGISEHNYENGFQVCGSLGNMKVRVTESDVTVKNSLTKYYIGNNIQDMGRVDIKKAIEKLSDELHLSFDISIAKRFDYAKNITLSQEIENYLPYLGEMSRYNRYPSKRGINYRIAQRELAIYNKIAEMKYHRDPVPPLFIGKNVMRIEKRYLLNVGKYFNRAEIKASDLYNEVFYTQVVEDWHNDYNRINKLSNKLIDMSTITTKRQLYSLGVQALVKMQGGEIRAIKNVQERFSRGELNKKQAYDLRAAIKESRNLNMNRHENELIKELDGKVKEAVNNYG
jgi:hypothetical protein